VIYAALAVWLLGILFMAVGTYRLWARMIRPQYVSWALLPGTLVAEMAYIFGCLVTGGEIRRAKIVPEAGSRKSGGDSEPATEATARLKVLGPIVASLLAVVACAAAILIVHALLGEPVLTQFVSLPSASLPKTLPTSWGAFWDQLGGQLTLLRRVCETWTELQWSNWRVPLFVYLAVCLSVRLAPVRRDLRATLAAVVAVAILIALLGLVWKRFDSLVQDVWPLVTYVWSLLLFLLVLTLLISAVAALVRVLSGKAKAS